jgi:hypothetical protein
VSTAQVVSIFIQISAYRDRELQKTIKDAIAKSSGQYELKFGVHELIAEDDEVVDLGVPTLTSVAPENLGVNAGRYLANSLYDGEDYYFQIDSHMRFVYHWDSVAVAGIKYYQSQGIAKPLMTMYPGNFWYEDGVEKFDSIQNFTPTLISFHEKPQQLVDTMAPSQMAKPTSLACAYTYSVSAANIFTLGEFANLPRDTRIMFWGEEILTAATAFCHGFDLVVPTGPLVWHLYHSGQSYEATGRHHAWQDYSRHWNELVEASKGCLEESLHNLNGIRSLEEFGDFAGIDFATRQLKGHQLTHGIE